MLADPAYGGNMDMVGWKWIGFPGDPMRRGDVYADYIFTKQALPVREQTAATRLQGGDGGNADRGSALPTPHRRMRRRIPDR